MIKATLFLNQDDKYVGFSIKGHAGYADKGQDIVCAAVSTLAITTCNAVETFTDLEFEGSMDPNGSIDFKFSSDTDEKGQLLLSTLALGLSEISKEYGKKFLEVHYKEV